MCRPRPYTDKPFPFGYEKNEMVQFTCNTNFAKKYGSALLYAEWETSEIKTEQHGTGERRRWSNRGNRLVLVSALYNWALRQCGMPLKVAETAVCSQRITATKLLLVALLVRRRRDKPSGRRHVGNICRNNKTLLHFICPAHRLHRPFALFISLSGRRFVFDRLAKRLCPSLVCVPSGRTIEMKRFIAKQLVRSTGRDVLQTF